ncbi:MAG: hypothetical protein RR881_02170 [Malacoplasma sp.]
MGKKIFLYSLINFALFVCACFVLTFCFDISDGKLNSRYVTNKKLNAKTINSNYLIDELNRNYNNFDNALDLNLDISNFIDYENDYYNYDKKPTEHIKLNPSTKSKVIFNILDLKKIYFIDQANFAIEDAYNILFNDNLNINIDASSYSVKLKNKFYSSSPISLRLQKPSFTLNANLVSQNPIDIDYCKILKVDLQSILFTIANSGLHNDYHYFNPNNNAYPSAILYMKSSISKNIKISFNKPITLYFLYDLNLAKLLSLNVVNFISDINNISNTLPTMWMDFNLEKLLDIWQLSNEYLENPLENSTRFYYHLLWTQAIPLYFINNKITATFEAYNNEETIVFWDNNKFIPFELKAHNNLNKQINTMWNIKDVNNNILMKIDSLFANSFSDNENIKLLNNKIFFYFTARITFLKIDKFSLMRDELLFNSDKYASQLVDENKNISNKVQILEFLNSQIKIESGLLFNEILTFDEINFDRFTNLEAALKPFGIYVWNNNFYLPTYNENGEIFFLVKIRNWKFINDLDTDLFQGDYSIEFKQQLINHKNFIYLQQKERFSDDGYFIVKVLTNKKTSIYDNGEKNILWKFNTESNLNSLKEHIKNEVNYKKTKANKSSFVYTYISEINTLNKDLTINFILKNPISFNYINPDKNNFGNPIENIFAMLCNLPINKELIGENKIIFENNNRYFLNNKYKFNIEQLSNGESSLNISNRDNEYFDLNISIKELLNLFANNLSKEEIDLTEPLQKQFVIEYKILNWYFVLFIVILFLMILGLVIYIFKEKQIRLFKK